MLFRSLGAMRYWRRAMELRQPGDKAALLAKPWTLQMETEGGKAASPGGIKSGAPSPAAHLPSSLHQILPVHLELPFHRSRRWPWPCGAGPAGRGSRNCCPPQTRRQETPSNQPPTTSACPNSSVSMNRKPKMPHV